MLLLWQPCQIAEHCSSQTRLPEFCAMINATLLVPGCIRMKPHSRCSGLLLSAWKALNLSGSHNKSNQWSWIINELSQNVLDYTLFLMCGQWSLYTNTWDKRVALKVIRKPTRSWWLVGPHGWSSASLCSGKAWWWGNSPHQVHQTPRSPGASREGEGLDSAPLMVKNNREPFHSTVVLFSQKYLHTTSIIEIKERLFGISPVFWSQTQQCLSKDEATPLIADPKRKTNIHTHSFG